MASFFPHLRLVETLAKSSQSSAMADASLPSSRGGGGSGVTPGLWPQRSGSVLRGEPLWSREKGVRIGSPGFTWSYCSTSTLPVAFLYFLERMLKGNMVQTMRAAGCAPGCAPGWRQLPSRALSGRGPELCGPSPPTVTLGHHKAANCVQGGGYLDQVPAQQGPQSQDEDA